MCNSYKTLISFLICMSVSFTSLCQTRQFEISPPRSSSGSESCGKEVRVMMTQISNFGSGLSVAGFSRNPPRPLSPTRLPPPHTVQAVHMIVRTHRAVLPPEPDSALRSADSVRSASRSRCCGVSLQLRLYFTTQKRKFSWNNVSTVTNEDFGIFVCPLLSFRLNNIL